jgi:hypothetical protein
MKRILILIGMLIVISFILLGCAARQLTPAELRITSVLDTTKCSFIKAEYFDVSPQTLIYWLRTYTYDAGGDSYKIINTVTEYYLLGGVKSEKVNFEIYKCKSDSK